MKLTKLQKETLDKITDKSEWGLQYEMATKSGRNIYPGLNGYAAAQLIKLGVIALDYENAYINDINHYAYIPIRLTEAT